MGNFSFFQQVRCEVIVKYTNLNWLEYEWTRTGIRTLEAQIDEKNKNIEDRQNVTGSYKKRVYLKISFSSLCMGFENVLALHSFCIKYI